MSRIRDDITRLTACLTTPSEHVRDRPELVTLLLGHLPIRAGLWRLPAARLLLPEASRIVVAREDEQELVVECIGDGFDPVATNLIPSCCACVMVPPSGASPELVADLDADRLAIITGGDQAAVVAAYALIKGLSVPLEVPVELIIVGQEEGEAAATAERLADAVVRHLGRVVDYRGVISAIGADTGLTQSRMLPRPMDGLLTIAREARGGVSPDHQPDSEARHRVVNAAGQDSSLPEHVSPEFEADSIAVPMRDSERVVLEPLPVASQDQIPPVTAPINPEAQVQRSPLETMDRDKPFRGVEGSREPQQAMSLCDHLPGLSVLGFRCPDHDSAEFALDETGALHLVVSASDSGGIPAIIGWTLRHWSLLGEVISGLPGQSVEPMVHVLSQDAQLLIGLRDTPWQTHLLVPVAQAGPQGLACVPLSRQEASEQGR